MDQESPWWKHPNSDSCWIPWFFLVGLAQHLFKNVSPDAKQVRPRNWYARSDDTYNCNHLYIKMQHIIAQPNKNGLVGHASKKNITTSRPERHRTRRNGQGEQQILRVDRCCWTSTSSLIPIKSSRSYQYANRRNGLACLRKTFVKTDLSKETGDVQKVSLGAMYSSALWSQVPGSSFPYSTPVSEKNSGPNSHILILSEMNKEHLTYTWLTWPELTSFRETSLTKGLFLFFSRMTFQGFTQTNSIKSSKFHSKVSTSSNLCY